MEAALRKLLPSEQFVGVSSVASEKMRRVRGTGNRSTESRLRFGLVSAGLKGWKMHVRELPGRPDFAFPTKRLVLFVDGCFWHGCTRCGHIPKTNHAFWTAKIKRNRSRDFAATRALRRSGYTVLRFWEHELDQDLTACIASIRLVLSNRQRIPRKRRVLKRN